MDSRRRLASEWHELRVQLKEWEKSFAETNSGRKPGKEDIKKNPDIAAKYKTYNRTRDVLDGKKGLESLHTLSPSARKHRSSVSSIRSEQNLGQTPSKTIFATPRKARSNLSESHPGVLDPYDPPAASVSPHPYVFKNAIGPTPQRDGQMRGLFDFLSSSGSAPSTRKRKVEALREGQDRTNVAQTPSRNPKERNEDWPDHLAKTPGARRHSRTPASDGKKFLLSQFFATPSTMHFAAIAEEDSAVGVEKGGLNQTPLRSRVLGNSDRAQTENALETTPAYLKRTTSFSQRLLTASSSNKQTGPKGNLAFASPSTIRTGPKLRPFKGKPLSEILRGLRQLEDNDDEDVMDALREIEGSGMNVPVGDSQIVPSGLAVGEEPARTWKKKGQKRTTRKIIMRPTTAPRKTRDEGREEEGEQEVEDDTLIVKETQAPLSVSQPEAEEEEGSADDLQPLLASEDLEANEHHDQDDPRSPAHDEFSDSDFDELVSTPRPKKRKIHATVPKIEKQNPNTSNTTTAKSVIASKKAKALEQMHPQTKQKNKNKKEKGTINPNAHSHQNFRSLKIRNKNSKGKGKGRFGRR